MSDEHTPDLLSAAAAPGLGAIARAIASHPDQALTVESLNAQQDVQTLEALQARREEYWRAKFGGPVPAWWYALQDAIATDPRKKAGVADKLGVSRPYVSRVVNFHMPVAPAAFAERVAAVYMQTQCPYLERAISPDECRAYARRDYAALSQFEVDHWKVCRTCASKAPPAPVTQARAGDAA